MKFIKLIKSEKYPKVLKNDNGKYCVLYAEGTKGKEFDTKEEAEKYCKSVKSGESYGWVVNPEDAWDKLQLWIDTVGAEAALDDIAKAIGTEELSSCLAFIFRNNDFKEGCSDFESEDDGE